MHEKDKQLKRFVETVGHDVGELQKRTADLAAAQAQEAQQRLRKDLARLRDDLARLRAAVPNCTPNATDTSIQQIVIVPTVSTDPAPIVPAQTIAPATPGGMDNQTGQAISGLAWLRQRVLDVLSTLIGSMPNRRGYGSRLPALLDAPINPSTLFEWRVAAIEALRKPVNGLADLVLRQVSTNPQPNLGRVDITIYGYRRDDGSALQFDAPIQLGAAS